MNLAKRSISSILWNVAVTPIYIIIGFSRAIILARLLEVSVFGMYAGIMAVIQITAIFASLGLGKAFLHRAPETEDENQAATAFFTLRILFSSIWAFLMLTGAFIWTQDLLFQIACVSIITRAVNLIAGTNSFILRRRVVHRRLAVLQLVEACLASVIAITLAYLGAGVWALVSIDIVTVWIMIIGLYVWKPVWKPKLAWNRKVIRYYLNFGWQNLLAQLLWRLLDRVDDLWANYFLGTVNGGFYAKAYQLATYPRQLVASPINKVVGGAYAELKHDRQRLSQAFFRVTALIVRSGFYLGGLLFLSTAEFVELSIGSKWLPIITTLRIMLVFTLLDPLKITVSDLFYAVGQPSVLIRARFTQLVVLILMISSLTIGFDLGIEGIAMAVNSMLIAGIIYLFLAAKPYVDISLSKIFVVPLFALALGVIVTTLTLPWFELPNYNWVMLIVKSVCFTIVYAALILLLEYKQLYQWVQIIRQNYLAGATKI